MSRTLYLIDGYGQIFRAYYAIRTPMRSPNTGEPTGALFGFTGMLIKLLGGLRPDFVAVALDAPGKTFRDDLYPAYKGTRDDTPVDLIAQFPRVSELIELFDIPTIGKPGLEADDIIATIVQRVLDDPALADVQIRVVSKDKDLEQLICGRVALYDIHTDTLIDEDALRENKGVRPDQVIDLLALTGDSVDNVPGVDGVGPKTASQLLQEYGSIEGIYANIESIKGKRRENLEKAQAHLPLSRKLVTLVRDGEFPFDLEACRTHSIDPDRIIPFFRTLGFNRYQDDVRRLPQAGRTGTLQFDEPAPLVPIAPSEVVASSGSYRSVNTAADLAELVEALSRQELFALDTETTSLGRDALLCGLSFSWEHEQGVYVPVRSPSPGAHLGEVQVLAALKPVLEAHDRPKCGHNLKFDAHVLLRSGVRLRGVVFDSMLAMGLLDQGQPAGLDHLAEKLLGQRLVPITDLIGPHDSEQRRMDEVPLEKIAPYAAEDADIALRLARHLMPGIEAAGMTRLMTQVEAPLTAVLAEMEANGITCDPVELRRQGEALGARALELRTEIHRLAGREFQIESPKQLAEVLFDELGFPSVKKTKTGRSTDIEVLEKLASTEDRMLPHTAVPRLLIEYRMLTKLIGTYLGNLAAAVSPIDGRIHTTFHQLVTATGRLASNDPNLQNIPVRTDVGRQIRKAFPAASGQLLICADYSQIELRILAHLSEDPGLVRAFENDEDIHAAVASQVFGVAPADVTREMRSHAKTINFGIIYGITAYGLSRRIEGLAVDAAARLIGEYKTRFPGIDRFMQQCVAQAMDEGFVSTMMGRRRAIPEIRSRIRTQQMLGQRLAINSVVQGSAADLIKLAMVRVQHRIDREALPMKMLVQIHDELVLEAPAEQAAALAELVRGEMEAAIELRVPLRAEAGIGPDWMSAK